jgi:hypothetical protein
MRVKSLADSLADMTNIKNYHASSSLLQQCEILARHAKHTVVLHSTHVVARGRVAKYIF